MDEQTVAPSNLDLARDRTGLAKFRTQLALDRTTLAWIRTALTMATFGFGTVGFFRTLRERSPSPEAARMHASAVQFGRPSWSWACWPRWRRGSPTGSCCEGSAGTKPSSWHSGP